MRLAELLSAGFPLAERPRAVYLHLPFCSSKCSYCDFHSLPLADEGFAARYVEVLLSRLSECVEALAGPVETLYLGGGTPTVLGERLFGEFLSGMASVVGPGLREWTCEANPESLSPAKIEAAARAGVSRLSLGIQSMDGEELAALGRRASPGDNGRALALAAASGLSVSADLIASVPLRTGGRKRRGGLLDSLDALLSSGVGHVSVYDLVVEEGTALSRSLERRELVLPDPDETYEERKEAERRLASAGFIRYEVSNFAKPGSECLHNGAYWDMRSYLGLGSGAVSTFVSSGPVFDPTDRGIASLRLSEGKELGAWIDAPDACLSEERLDPGKSAAETIMMGLRTKKGVDGARFEARFGLTPQALLERSLRRWEGRLMRTEHGGIAPDDEGLDLLNPILVDAFEDIERHWEDQHGR